MDGMQGKLEIELDALDWAAIGQQLDADGHAVLPGLLDAGRASRLAGMLAGVGRDEAVLVAGEGGCGGRLYFGTVLPDPLESLRSLLYRRLVPTANRWNHIQGLAHRYPAAFRDFQRQLKDAGQMRPQSHLSRLGEGEHVALHQRNEGLHVFPLQLVAVLSEVGVDFQGGECVTTEQRPRMQSRPGVLPLKRGDVAVIATAGRPFRGASGYYRVNLKHAISRVHAGERIGLEVFFHDAP